MAKSIAGGVEIVNTLSTKNNGDYPLVKAESVGMENGSSAEEVINNKLDKNQGSSNSGKVLGINADGNVIPVDAPTGGGSSVEVDTTLTQSGKAADSKTVGDKISSLKGNIDEIDKQIYTIAPKEESTEVELAELKDLNGKLDKNQGAENSGKFLSVNQSGEIVPSEIPTSGSVELDKTLTQSDKAADAKVVGDELKKKQPVGNYLTEIPSEYITETELNGKKFPNPHKLTFEGSVTAEYDGSGSVSVVIPETGRVERVEKLASDTTVDISPNKLYVFPEMANLTVTLGAVSDTKIVNEYHFVFKSGATPTVLSIPQSVNTPSSFSVLANTVYEVSIMENCMTYQSWEVSA